MKIYLFIYFMKAVINFAIVTKESTVFMELKT